MARTDRPATLLKVNSGARTARTAKSRKALLSLAGDAVRGAKHPPAWLHFVEGDVQVVASLEAGLVATCVDGGEFHDDFFEQGRLIALPAAVHVMGTDERRKFTDALIPKVSAYDHEGSVVLADLRWLDEVPSARDARRIWKMAFDAFSGMLPTWEPPVDGPIVTTPAQAASVRTAWLGGFERQNAFAAACWKKVPSKVRAVQAPVCGGERGGDPIALDGVVYGASASTAGALDVGPAKPVVRWEKVLASGSNVVVQGGFIDTDALVLALGDRLCALGLDDGAVRVSVPVAGIVSAPVRFEDTWVVTTKTGVVAVDLGTRRKKWSCAFPNKYATGGLALAGDVLFTSPDRLLAIDARTGKVRWKALSLAGAPVVHEQTVFADSLGSVHALDVKTGKPRWVSARKQGQDPVHGGRLAVGAGLVLFRAEDGSVRALDEQTGRERWKSEPGDPMGRNAVTVLADCVVFVRFVEEMGVASELIAIDTKSGKLRWRVAGLPEGHLDHANWYSALVPVVAKSGSLEALIVPTQWGALVVRP